MIRPAFLALFVVAGCSAEELASLPSDDLGPPPTVVSMNATEITVFGGNGSLGEWIGEFNPVAHSDSPRVVFFGNAVDSTAPEGRPTHLISSPWPGGMPNYVLTGDWNTVGLDYDAADSVGFVPHGGDNSEFGEVDLKGESFVFIKSDATEGGVGMYAHVGPRFFLNGPRDTYMTGMFDPTAGLGASGAGVRLRARHRITYPFVDPAGAPTDLRIELLRSKMVVGDFPPLSSGIAQCRNNNNITLDNDRTGHFLTLNLRSHTVSSDPSWVEPVGTGLVNRADGTHYNLYPGQGTTRSRSLRDRHTGAVVGRSYGDAHGNAVDPQGRDIDVVVTFGQLKQIMLRLASAENRPVADMFGSEWDHRSAWRVKVVGPRLEITGPQQDTEVTRCGASLGEMRVSGVPR